MYVYSREREREEAAVAAAERARTRKREEVCSMLYEYMCVYAIVLYVLYILPVAI